MTIDTKALRELMAKATPERWARRSLCGSWRIFGGLNDKLIASDKHYGDKWSDDSALIVAMRNALPALLDAVDRLAEVTRERDEYKKTPSIAVGMAYVAAEEAMRDKLAESRARVALLESEIESYDRHLKMEHALHMEEEERVAELEAEIERLKANDQQCDLLLEASANKYAAAIARAERWKACAIGIRDNPSHLPLCPANDDDSCYCGHVKAITKYRSLLAAESAPKGDA